MSLVGASARVPKRPFFGVVCVGNVGLFVDSLPTNVVFSVLCGVWGRERLVFLVTGVKDDTENSGVGGNACRCNDTFGPSHDSITMPVDHE